MPEVCLLPSKLYSGYFGVKRFDRESDEMLSREPFEEPAKGATGGPLGKPPVGSPLKSQHRKIHMVSVAGLLETSHRIPNLDYSQLMKLTLHLTQDMTELKRLFRQMCFNVYARNRDDHSKNFSFLYHETQAVWRLSPAYDLTCSSSHYGEHATTIAGNGRDPGLDDILAVAKQAGLSQRWAKTTALEIKEKTTVLERFWRV
jgi:serine/threonine-protein kinase HipA